MTNLKNFEYDSDFDILYIYKKNESEPVKGSIIFNNLTFDISPSGEVVGMQIDNASEFLQVKQDILTEIKQAKITVTTQGNVIGINWAVFSTNLNSINTFMIPKNKIALTC